MLLSIQRGDIEVFFIERGRKRDRNPFGEENQK
jgi:hypothetical protein